MNEQRAIYRGIKHLLMLHKHFKRVSNDCLQVAPAGGVTLDDSQTPEHAWKAKKVMSSNGS
jgi:hypothetical protein